MVNVMYVYVAMYYYIDDYFDHIFMLFFVVNGNKQGKLVFLCIWCMTW